MNFGGPGSSTLGGLGGFNPGVGRDPRARAKTREYLKQCLQEITYLTSAAALNPLPERTPGGVSRPRKEMREIAAAKEKEPLEVPPPAAASVVQQDKEGNRIVPLDPAAAASAEKAANTEVLQATSTTGASSSEMSAEIRSENSTAISRSDGAGGAGGNPSLNGPLARKAEPTIALTSIDPPQAVADLFTTRSTSDTTTPSTANTDDGSQVTAIFRPESSEEWQKALKKAGQTLQPRGSAEQGVGPPTAGDGSAGNTISMKEVQERQQGAREAEARQNGVPGSTMRGRSDTAVLAGSSTSQKEMQDANEHKSWKPRRTLRT
jgi:striatin 1/3/4